MDGWVWHVIVLLVRFDNDSTTPTTTTTKALRHTHSIRYGLHRILLHVASTYDANEEEREAHNWSIYPAYETWRIKLNQCAWSVTPLFRSFFLLWYSIFGVAVGTGGRGNGFLVRTHTDQLTRCTFSDFEYYSAAFTVRLVVCSMLWIAFHPSFSIQTLDTFHVTDYQNADESTLRIILHIIFLLSFPSTQFFLRGFDFFFCFSSYFALQSFVYLTFLSCFVRSLGLCALNSFSFLSAFSCWVL